MRQGRPKHRWKDTLEADLKWCGLQRKDKQDRERWKGLVEKGIYQKPATRKDKGSER